MSLKHISVLLEESIKGLDIKPNGIYIDGTVGGGGHSFFIANKLLDTGKLICIDQDLFALDMAKKKLFEFDNKIIFVHDNFCNIKLIANKNNFDSVDGILLDLGVSSFQIDDCERGFSYIKNSRLDMRMDKTKKLSAFDIINYYDKKELEAIIKNYGEEKFYKQIVNKIFLARNIKPIETTFELVDIIKSALPKKVLYNNSHPAKKTFQAIRIAVNNELDILEKTIIDCVDLLKPGGRLCIISFHSLEDRIIKNSFKKLCNPCVCPRDFPVCVCNKKSLCDIITKKPICPSELEIKNNPRAHSAKLRIIKKI